MARPDKQEHTGLRGVLYLTAAVILTALVVLLQIKFRGFEGPLSDYILIITLIIANFLLLAAVVFMIARSLWKLSVERRKGVLGAKFRTKLVTAFVSLAFIPTILLFIIGSGMFTRSIERVFNIKVENSLKDSVSVAQAYYDRLQTQANAFGRQISRQMTEERLLHRFDKPVLAEYLRKKAGEYGLGAVELLVSQREKTAVVVTAQFPEKTFTATPTDLIERAFAGEKAAGVTDLGKKGEIVRSVVPIFAPGDKNKVIAAVSVNYYVSQSLAAKADGIRAGYAEYRSTLRQKEPIKLAYRLGFLAVTLALLLAAIWVGLRLAAGITVPIGKLAEGTVALASGNLDYRIDEKTEDEIGMLIDSFNKMTADLKNSRERLTQEVFYKETILSNIDTGVVSMDRSGKIATVNPAARKILDINARDVLDKRYDEAFGFIDLEPVRGLFRKLDEGHGHAEGELSLNASGRMLTLRMRISTLKDSTGALLGSVITFDDLTELLRAKKAETWQDVARRVAHEFKNPLTPIKLSAERLRKKHAEGAADFEKVFDECSLTIVREADGLRKLVDEFANFARMPASHPVPQQLAPVLESVVQLYAGAHKDLVIETNITPGLPEALLDREQIKRVFINLFENAVEAMGRKGTLRVSARLTDAGTARVEVADEGPGILPEDMPKLFQPDFSRKKNGGLGLAIALRIIKDHSGVIRVEQNKPKGARFIVELPVYKKSGDPMSG